MRDINRRNSAVATGPNPQHCGFKVRAANTVRSAAQVSSPWWSDGQDEFPVDKAHAIRSLALEHPSFGAWSCHVATRRWQNTLCGCQRRCCGDSRVPLDFLNACGRHGPISTTSTFHSQEAATLVLDNASDAVEWLKCAPET